MITNKNICLIHTGNSRKSKSIDDLYKEELKGGIMYMRCPQSGSEIPIQYNSEKERMEWIEIKRQIRKELEPIN